MNSVTALFLTKAEIESFEFKINKQGKLVKSGKKTMSLQINPNSVSHTLAATQTEKNEHSKNDQNTNALGSPVPNSKPYQGQKESFSFDFVLDATGIIPGCEDVKKSLKEFKDMTYSVEGGIHRPRIVNIVWGKTFGSKKKDTLVNLELKSLSVNYTLFKPSGTPLRATVKVSFEEYVVFKNELLDAGLESPDMTHLRTVGVGDSLPAMCNEIYGDGNYCLEVARYNNLNSILNIKPGQKLFFPPLEK